MESRGRVRIVDESAAQLGTPTCYVRARLYLVRIFVTAISIRNSRVGTPSRYRWYVTLGRLFIASGMRYVLKVFVIAYGPTATTGFIQRSHTASVMQHYGIPPYIKDHPGLAKNNTHNLISLPLFHSKHQLCPADL